MKSTNFTALLIILSLVLLAAESTPVVQWQGSLRAVHQGDSSAKVDLKSFADTAHLYALGPVAELDGEVTIINGKAHVAQVRNGEIETHHTYAASASFLVWSEVPAWKDSLPLGKSTNTLSELDALIETLARQQGRDISSPFPFLLEGTFDSVDFHVLSPPSTKQPSANHKEGAKNVSVHKASGKILGFFSRHHAGVFTHHGSATHLHIVLENGQSGHVDALAINPETQIVFPK